MRSQLHARFNRNAIAAALLACTLPAFGQGSLEEQGKKFVDATCNTCHAIGARTGSGYTPEGWDTVLRMMTNHGVQIPADQLPAAKARPRKDVPGTRPPRRRHRRRAAEGVDEILVGDDARIPAA